MGLGFTVVDPLVFSSGLESPFKAQIGCMLQYALREPRINPVAHGCNF